MTISAAERHQCAREALRYRTREEWKKGSPKTYSIAEREEIVFDLLPDRCPNARYYSYEECEYYCKLYGSRSKWSDEHWSSYFCARVNDWMGDITQSRHSSKRTLIDYTLDKAKLDATTYENESDWRRHSNSYNFAKANGWVGFCETKSDLKRNVVQPIPELQLSRRRSLKSRELTYGECFVRGARFQNRTEWCRGDIEGWEKAKQEGWMALIFPLVKERKLQGSVSQAKSWGDFSQKRTNTPTKRGRSASFEAKGLSALIGAKTSYKKHKAQNS